MKQQVSIIPVRIKKAGQQYSFQYRLPRTSAMICGIATDVVIKTALPVLPPNPGLFVLPNLHLGRLQLQLADRHNLFYAAEVFAEDNNCGQGEIFAAPSTILPPAGIFPVTGKKGHFFNYGAGTHGRRLEPLEVGISGSRMISGLFRDYCGKALNTNLHYVMNVYVWTKISNR